MSDRSERPEIIAKMLERSGTQEIDPTTLRGSVTLGVNLVRLLYRTFSGKKPVAWINVFTPPELIFGCGYLPFWLDGTSSFSSWTESTDVYDNADAVLPSRDMCTFLRVAVGGATTDLFPKPDAVLCTSHLCEGAPKVARMSAETFDAPFELLEAPGYLSEAAVEAVAARFEEVAHRLCEIANSKFEVDKLSEAIELSNQARKHFYDVYEMRKRVPAPVTGSQFIGIALMYPWGTKTGVSIAESFSEEIAERIADGIPAVEGGEKFRLLWIHLRPMSETDIMARLEQELRAVVVADLLGEVWWRELDANDPFRALAIKMLSNPELLPTEKRIERILRTAEEYRVDGVIHFLQWGCRWNYGQSGIFKDAVTRAGLPFLSLDGDAVDRKATPHGQILTRLEGFVELLESARSSSTSVK